MNIFGFYCVEILFLILKEYIFPGAIIDTLAKTQTLTRIVRSGIRHAIG